MMVFWSWIYRIGCKLIDDTLMRDKDGTRRFSRESLTMFGATLTVFFSYFYDLLTFGFRMESFLVMVGLAGGIQITDAISKRINKDNSKQ